MQPEIAHLHKRHPYQGAIWIAVIALIALCVCAQGVQGAGTATQRSPTATMTAKPTLTPRPTLTAEQVKEQPIQAVTMSHHAKFILYKDRKSVV